MQRTLILCGAFLLFLSANIYLWATAISRASLLLIAAALGIVYFAFMMWLVARDPADTPNGR